MIHVIEPGKKEPDISFVDHIIYSNVKDLEGKPLALDLSFMAQSGNSELKAATGENDASVTVQKKPAIVWLSGGGYRGVDKNQMIAETQFFAAAGYAVFSVYYRSSAQGHFPDQLIDVKTAVRYIRAHAEEYQIDPDHIAVMGRSAGGHLATLAGQNLKGYDTEEWAEYSSDVQAVCDMFGPIDVVTLMKYDLEQMATNPEYRWKTVPETHGGAFIGGSLETHGHVAEEASPIYNSLEHIAPIVILHGDADPLVPCALSEAYYNKIVESGQEDKAELYIIKGAGHGTPEFFQSSVKQIIVDFYDKYLK